MKRYIVGYIRKDKTPEVELQEIDQHGKYVGEPVLATAFSITGTVTTSEYGQVILVDYDDTLDVVAKGTKPNKPKQN